MIRHVFTMVWRRKRASTMILVELLVCFLVLSVLFAQGLYLLFNYMEPAGFAAEDVWLVTYTGCPRLESDTEERRAGQGRALALLAAARELPGTRVAAYASNTPYSFTSIMNSVWIDGRQERMLMTPVMPEVREVLGLELVAGRWLEPGDEVREEIPTVITRQLAADLWPGEDPVGRLMPHFGDNGEIVEPEADADIYRVVGVLKAYKRDDPFAASEYASFVPFPVEDPEYWLFPQWLLVRGQPGAGAVYERDLLAALDAVEPGWEYEANYLPDMRAGKVRQRMQPMAVGWVVAAFLLLMVALGLVGVLWQSLIRRTSELGLRRALGASAAGVQRQILGELLALTSLAVLVGTAIFVQGPILGVAAFVPWHVHGLALTMAAALIGLIVVISGLVPSWLATKIQPARALQYE